MVVKMMMVMIVVLVSNLNIKEEGGGGGEEPGAQGEAAQIALDGQALPPLQDILVPSTKK